MIVTFALFRRRCVAFSAVFLAVGWLLATPVSAESTNNSKLKDKPESSRKVAPEADRDAEPPASGRRSVRPPQGAVQEPPSCPTNTDKLELLV
jgi:hypothetical protein